MVYISFSCIDHHRYLWPSSINCNITFKLFTKTHNLWNIIVTLHFVYNDTWYMYVYIVIAQYCLQPKVDPEPVHRARTPCWIFLRVYIWKFWQHNKHKLYFNQIAMFTMCILLSTLTNKAWGICKGASKQPSDLKNYTAPGPRPPSSKIPRSATDNISWLYSALSLSFHW